MATSMITAPFKKEAQWLHNNERDYLHNYNNYLKGKVMATVIGLRDPLIFYFPMPLNDLFDDIVHQIPAYRLY